MDLGPAADEQQLEDDDAPEDTLVARLTRRWVDEREAPEVLPHAEDDVEECLLLMRMQVRPLFASCCPYSLLLSKRRATQ